MVAFLLQQEGLSLKIEKGKGPLNIAIDEYKNYKGSQHDKEKIEIIDMLIDKDAECDSPLLHKIFEQDELDEQFKKLIVKNLEFINTPGSRGSSFLDKATSWKKKEMVAFLLQQEGLSLKIEKGKGPLNIAIDEYKNYKGSQHDKEKIEIIDMLIDKDAECDSPLLHKIFEQDELDEQFKKLIVKNLEFINTPGSHGSSFLDKATSWKKKEMVTFLTTLINPQHN